MADEGKNRYTHGWDPEKWEEEFEKHPIFMTKSPSENAELPPLVEAIQQLKYDSEVNSRTELALNYKEDGNQNFKHRKYRWAIDSYSEGIKQNCDDNSLNSQLYANRAACHFHLKNYRSSLNDCLKALEYNPSNGKAILRAAESYFALLKYKECIEFCRIHKQHFSALEELEKKAFNEQKVLERDIRKKEAEERKVRIFKDKIEAAVKSRGIAFKGSLFDSNHPAATGKHVIISESGDLIWPVLFVYPEYGQTDFIESFNENDTFISHLEVMFGDEDNAPNWDKYKKYKPNSIKIAYATNDSEKMVSVNPKSKLKDVLSLKTFECVKPVKSENVVGIHTKKKVEVSLGDCLACSGCITSAETVLIAKQSHKELHKVLSENKVDPEKSKLIVMSLSHQSIASIAAKYCLEFQDAAEKLASFFFSRGVDYIFDLTFARHISLLESQKEFIERYNCNTPVLTSACPGFVCYVEKTHGELLVPLLSKVRSPQQVMGSFIKHVWRKNMRIEKELYHVTVMPCYDKKLEASREEFLKDDINDVDCVLTPLEIDELLDSEGITLSSLTNRRLDVLVPHLKSTKIEKHLGSGSGGYAENIFRYASSALFREKFDSNQPLDFKMRRNRDFMEFELKDKSNDNVLLSFAIVNGFRNIQTLVQRIKRKTCSYHFVEVMACPSGCLNGGGQLRGIDSNDKLLSKVQQLYNSLQTCKLSLNLDNEIVKHLYNEYFPTTDSIENLLRTKFRIVPKSTNNINVNW
ncbi:tetratricopeptide repeat containing cytosolic Fe-S cluster assembly factor-like protein [Dinothrombium tinctorium]|uniref:Tetratricopeptide repeat containing cytosolic Fe-S cluster assembly factor-like protein n=1 Tax=Dinothrombium tinctorium TaxID=1965070 RepID=A0A3S3Q9Q0_9ACAR|nr:tetratricopeptide repeat containing cytosolic Fe-S cluster assembly factor-like protein [Dinothrombium tinctorium]